MPVGMSTYTANAIFNAVFNNTAFAVAVAYLQLHIGDPGAAGTANQATDTTRKAISAASPAGGEVTTDAVLVWSPLSVPPGGEQPTHFSAWDASSAGNFLGSGTITTQPVAPGEELRIAAGDLDFALPVAT